MPYGHERTENGQTQGGGFDPLSLALDGYCACFWPFMRHSFGVAALDKGGLAAIGVMIGYAGFGHCPEILFVIPVWLAFVIWHRIATVRRESRGIREHSRYDGWPWLAMLLFRVKPWHETRAKFVCEPMLVLILGLVTAAWSLPLAQFLVLGSMALVIRTGIGSAVERAHDQAMTDAAIVMRQRAERFRRGGRY